MINQEILTNQEITWNLLCEAVWTTLRRSQYNNSNCHVRLLCLIRKNIYITMIMMRRVWTRLPSVSASATQALLALVSPTFNPNTTRTHLHADLLNLIIRWRCFATAPTHMWVWNAEMLGLLKPLVIDCQIILLTTCTAQVLKRILSSVTRFWYTPLHV